MIIVDVVSMTLPSSKKAYYVYNHTQKVGGDTEFAKTLTFIVIQMTGKGNISKTFWFKHNLY